MGIKYNLGVSSTQLELYRGDYERISSFRFLKTDKYCLVGQGIYLTNNKDIANSYRIKGSRSWESKDPVLFYGVVANRTEAYEKAFPEFCQRKWQAQGGSRAQSRDKNNKAYAKFCMRQAEAWRTAIAVGEVTASYIRQASLTGLPTIEVRYGSADMVGFLSTFSFDKVFFERNILNLYIAQPRSLWELLYDEGFRGQFQGSREQFVQTYARQSVGSLLTLSNSRSGRNRVYAHLRHSLEPYGIIGFEYEGGVALGGRRHRAFCVWDEDYVNQHKVCRSR